MAAAPYVLSSPPETTNYKRPTLGRSVKMGTPTRRGSASEAIEDVEMETRASSDAEAQASTADDQDIRNSTPDPCPPSSVTGSTTLLDTQHRLLYRGALGVSGSAIVLEGIQFVARLPGITRPLLTAPLPVALESMRGIPALKLLGTMKLSPDTARLDTEIDVYLHIHPQAYVTHAYFQRVLALSGEYIPERTLLRWPHPHPHIDPRVTSVAVKIGLGEDVIVVYGRIQAEEYARIENGQGPAKMQLVAARLVDPTAQSDSEEEEDDQVGAVFAVPIEQVPRPPRPDDPLPREPPTRPILKRTTSQAAFQRTVSMASGSGSGSSSAAGMKRTASGRRSLAFGRVRSQVVVRGVGEQVDTPQVKSKSKEPTSSVKGKSRAKPKSKAGEDKGDGGEDPFVSGAGEVDPGAVLPKMTARAKSAGTTGGDEEATNKAMIKRLAQSALETYGVDREDAGFKEVFGYVTRGVGFAFRNKMKSEKIARGELRKMVVRHVEMYVAGNGEVSAPA